MIRLKNRSEEMLNLFAAGTQAVSANSLSPVLCPYQNAFISSVMARLRTAGTTGTQTTELRKNGTAIGGGGVATFSFASGSTIPTYGVGTAAVTLTKGDILALVTTAVNTTPGVDLAVTVTISKQRELYPGDGPSTPPQVDTVLGSDADLYA